MIYQEVVNSFRQAGYDVTMLETSLGCVASIAAAGRVIAFAPSVDVESFLFNLTGIRNSSVLKDNLFCDNGTLGGDRLWIALDIFIIEHPNPKVQINLVITKCHQVPPNSVIVLPLKRSAPPIEYFNLANTQLTNEALGLYVGGKANAKIGYGADLATGNSAVFFMSGNELNVVCRFYSAVADGYYCDGLSRQPTQKTKYYKHRMVLVLVNSNTIRLLPVTERVLLEVSDVSYMHAYRGKPELVMVLAAELLEIFLVMFKTLILSKF